MSNFEEIMALLDITKQLTEMQETIDKMKDKAGIYELESHLVGTVDVLADTIQDQIYKDVSTIREINKKVFKGPADLMQLEMAKQDILVQRRDYIEKFLPNYQKLVEQLLDKKDDIEKNVEVKRQDGENVPSKEDTSDALQEAGKKFKQAINESPRLQRTYHSTKSFFDSIKPYVEPLVQAAKIIIPLLF